MANRTDVPSKSLTSEHKLMCLLAKFMFSCPITYDSANMIERFEFHSRSSIDMLQTSPKITSNLIHKGPTPYQYPPF